MPLIIGAKSATATGYAVDNSCRFNAGDSPKLEVTNGTATDNQKWTCSFWIKVGRGAVGVAGCLMAAKSGSPYFYLYIDDVYRINFYGNDKDGSNDVAYVTNRLFRDPSAWYHIVAAMDSTLATAGDRFRIYVNGVEETSFSTETDPTQNKIYPMNYTGFAVNVASRDDDVNPYDGYMAEVCLIDGQQLTPSSFGEFDSSSPTIWKPKDVSGLTFGNNGFYLDFEDSADLGADASGNSNDLTATNLAAIDQGIDSPTNNFCVMNPIVGTRSGFTWSYGNTKLVTGNNDGSGSTMGISKGKWYYEILIDDLGNFYGGWQDLSSIEADFAEFVPVGAIAMNNSPDLYYNGSGTAQSTGFDPVSSFTTGDYIGLAFDHDNLSLWWSTNGQWYTSDNATASTLTRAQVSANTNGFDCTTASTMSSSSVVAPFMGCSTSATTNSFNFGNGRFGGTALTGTTYTDDNGQGIFKYEPPDGFRALCTKNLAEYG